MPRLPRKLLPADGLYHATARGAGRITIFRDDDDRRTFLALLAKAVDRHSWECLAFCLMGNHYHLLLDTELCRLSSGLHWLNTLYARGFNDRHARWGHLFGDRFACSVVETAEHAEEACAYIVENPVRAGLCAEPQDWPWSGMRRLDGEGFIGWPLAVRTAARPS